MATMEPEPLESPGRLSLQGDRSWDSAEDAEGLAGQMSCNAWHRLCAEPQRAMKDEHGATGPKIFLESGVPVHLLQMLVSFLELYSAVTPNAMRSWHEYNCSYDVTCDWKLSDSLGNTTSSSLALRMPGS